MTSAATPTVAMWAATVVEVQGAVDGPGGHEGDLGLDPWLGPLRQPVADALRRDEHAVGEEPDDGTVDAHALLLGDAGQPQLRSDHPLALLQSGAPVLVLDRVRPRLVEAGDGVGERVERGSGVTGLGEAGGRLGRRHRGTSSVARSAPVA
jgi:hypothetical protein